MSAHSNQLSLSLLQDIRGLVRMSDAGDEDHVGFRILGSQPQDRLVGGRFVPCAHMLSVREFDDDQMSRPTVFDDLELAAMDDEATAEGLQRGIDLLELFFDPRSWRDVAHMGNGVGGHDCTPSASKPINRPRKGNVPKHRPQGDYARGNGIYVVWRWWTDLPAGDSPPFPARLLQLER